VTGLYYPYDFNFGDDQLPRKIDDFASTITDYEALIKMLEKLRTQAGGTVEQLGRTQQKDHSKF
jgi:hypothetical protein